MKSREDITCCGGSSPRPSEIQIADCTEPRGLFATSAILQVQSTVTWFPDHFQLLVKSTYFNTLYSLNTRNNTSCAAQPCEATSEFCKVRLGGKLKERTDELKISTSMNSRNPFLSGTDLREQILEK